MILVCKLILSISGILESQVAQRRLVNSTVARISNHFSFHFSNSPSTTSHRKTKTMEDSDGLPIFAFQDLDYIPSGFGGILAPYIETTVGTMRAAATLMRLGLTTDAEDGKGSGVLSTHPQVVCDLGCGDGYFRTDASSISLSEFLTVFFPSRLHFPCLRSLKELLGIGK